MPTVPEDLFAPWLPWQATNHIVERCDASSGHAVAPVAFCDNSGRAAFIARACNVHDDMLEALRSAHCQLVLLGGDPKHDPFGDKMHQAVLDMVEAAIEKAEVKQWPLSA